MALTPQDLMDMQKDAELEAGFTDKDRGVEESTPPGDGQTPPADGATTSAESSASPEKKPDGESAKKEDGDETPKGQETPAAESPKKEDQAAPGETAAQAEPKVDDSNVVKELRGLVRDQSRLIKQLTEANKTNTEALRKAGLLPEETPEQKTEREKLETLQTQRDNNLDTILETMKLTEAYKDVDEVVSQDHFDDAVDAMARLLVRKEGGKVEEVRVAIEKDIWNMPNPYKFMYDLIKEHHPAYKKAAPTKDAATVKAGDASSGEPKPKEQQPKEAPGSVAAAPGGESSSPALDTKGWTAAAIDSMDEEDLAQARASKKLPDDVYEAYLRNDLK